MIIRDFGIQTRVKYVYGAEEVRVCNTLHSSIVSYLCSLLKMSALKEFIY